MTHCLLRMIRCAVCWICLIISTSVVSPLLYAQPDAVAVAAGEQAETDADDNRSSEAVEFTAVDPGALEPGGVEPSGVEPRGVEPGGGGSGVVGPSSWGRRETLLASVTIFALAVFLGFELITKVPPTLHTPLMSGSNAISGITVVGAILAAGVASTGWLVPVLGALAVAMATINVVGGFAVTHRMLAMFKRK